MTRLGTLLGGACLLALAGCGGSEADYDRDAGSNTAVVGAEAGTDAAANGTAAMKGDGGVWLQPGQWEMKVEVKSAGLPAMPAAVADAMKNIATTTTTCLTEEDANKPVVFTGNTDQNCKSEGFTNEGGRVAGTLTCGGGGNGQGKMTVKTEGQFTATSFETISRSVIDAQGGKMTTEARVVGKRLGECDILEDNVPKKRTGG
jgi:hypothetical protein